MKKTIKSVGEQIKSSKKIQRSISVSLVCLILILSAIYWIYSSRYVSTDDGYVNANVVQVASRVTGQVARLNVVNNQYVSKGQLLFELDPEPFKVALAKARAEEALAIALLNYTEVTTARTETLVQTKVLPIQTHDTNVAKLQSAIAGLQLTKTSINQAQLNLDYAKTYAVTNGWVTNMTLREGNMVTANQLLFALVSSDEFWIDANFKETELEQVRPGQKAEIEIDMYPHHTFRGVVESVSGGSGTAFSLLPPQNATGNWVKVTQRVPVKVRILDVDPHYPLRIGTTATVKVYVKGNN